LRSVRVQYKVGEKERVFIVTTLVLTTANRSFVDVSAEISSAAGLGAGNWRFAIKNEFQGLISNLFGFSYTGGFDNYTPPFGDLDCSGQLIPDTGLSSFSAFPGDAPLL
jgi:hypothetical protein